MLLDVISRLEKNTSVDIKPINVHSLSVSHSGVEILPNHVNVANHDEIRTDVESQPQHSLRLEKSAF